MTVHDLVELDLKAQKELADEFQDDEDFKNLCTLLRDFEVWKQFCKIYDKAMCMIKEVE